MPESQLQRELRETQALGAWIRDQLYSLDAGARRARATTAIAVAAAEEAYRLTDQLPEWCNETSVAWRDNLVRVWEFLAGNRAQHYALSREIAEFLTSPLNHNEGQDGPDDFDRPQTVASYSAVVSAVMWGVDFALTAVMQVFECLDLKYGGDFTDERTADVEREINHCRSVVKRVIAAENRGGSGLTPEVLAAIRRSPG